MRVARHSFKFEFLLRYTGLSALSMHLRRLANIKKSTHTSPSLHRKAAFDQDHWRRLRLHGAKNPRRSPKTGETADVAGKNARKEKWRTREGGYAFGRTREGKTTFSSSFTRETTAEPTKTELPSEPRKSGDAQSTNTSDFMNYSSTARQTNFRF